MEVYLAFNRILTKDFARHVQQVSERVKQASLAEAIAKARPVIYMEISTASKADLARSIAARDKIRKGLICVALAGAGFHAELLAFPVGAYLEVPTDLHRRQPTLRPSQSAPPLASGLLRRVGGTVEEQGLKISVPQTVEEAFAATDGFQHPAFLGVP